MNNLRAVGNWVIVELDKEQKKSPGGIILTPGSGDIQVGRVVSTNNNDVKAGQKVYFRDGNPYELRHRAQNDQVVIHYDDVVAVEE